MKDEIKEIISYLKNNTFIPDETKRKYKILHRDEVNKLLDYITNLQQENEKLLDENIAIKDIVVEKDSQIKEMILQKTDYIAINILEMKLEDYKSRVEKAVEYINKNKHLSMFADCREPEEEWNYDLEINPRDLLNILQGESHEEWPFKNYQWIWPYETT